MSDTSRRHFLRGAGIAAAGSLLPPSIARALAIPADRRTGTIQDVQHVVILMQENRSFDHYYGALRGVQGFGDPHPVPLPGGRPVWEQRDRAGRVIAPFHLDTRTSAALKVSVLPHSWEDATGASDQGRWDGWIPYKTPLTMGHYRREDIPFQYALAEAFTICDAYHCSVHGQTNPNRLFMWAGGNDPHGRGGGPVVANSSGVALDFEIAHTPEMEEAARRFKLDLSTYGKGPRYTYTTYPERLEAAGIGWKVYQDPTDNFWGLTNPAVAFQAFNDAKPGTPLHDKAMARHTIDDLRADVLAGTLPQVSWIAPSQSQSEHPAGSSPAEGADFTARVIEALTADPAVWARTVLFMTFDENDGFFDHVTPPSPPGFNPDGSRAGASTVDTSDDIHAADKTAYGLSVRVPMIVASPWSTGGWVNSQVFDHTSILRFLETRFGVVEPNITPWRRAVCGDLTTAFDFSKSKQGHATLPDTRDAVVRVEAALKLPAPVPPAQGQPLFQETGTRPSRALPYALAVEDRLDDRGMSLAFRNLGTAGVVYQVIDLLDLAALPRHFTVEPGKTLRDVWPVKDRYHLQVRGPNRWFREYAGAAGEPLTAQLREHGDAALELALANRGAALATLRCHDRLAQGVPVACTVAARGQREWTVPLRAEHGFWYDVVIEGGVSSSFFRRMSGRRETGRDTTSRPV
ncbi:phospholipase C, phosphocholine-specific [Sphingomonas populi]|uniref:phospholipase C n=1 Tax=Sphingomonas populi TaxID=2484750 RepID=A0A4Q6XM49_9SPHN|nr:phospholipase C, phosphocholine-specific [Sphingomonas populi]RZF61103.1 phospholipase C, phosphocholine-specific [Sphingomonas populi]